jgi:GNAT superfamily N-acetyltransferase
MLHAGEISSACSRAGVDQKTAGAWCGEPVPKPLRVRIGKLQYSSMFAMTCQSGCSAIPKVSPLHGARSPRGQRTVTLAVPNDAVERPEQVWSLVCFFIRRELRGQGLTKQVIEAAVQCAEKRGATVVEAYPVDPGSPSYRFMGYVQTFIAAGFRVVGRAGTRRHVMRRELCR